MRLIDADELKKDDEVTMWLSNDAIRTGKQLKMFSEYFINKIDNMPTVNAIPMSVIDDIRADIQKEENIWYHDCEPDFSKNFDVIRVDIVLDIINKHTKG